MQLPDSDHTGRPWRIHHVAPDFALDDVWALPTPGGGPEDLPRLIQTIFSGDIVEGAPPAVRLLWEARWKFGGWLGWDDQNRGLDTRVPSLKTRLPDDLRSTSPQSAVSQSMFSPLYQLHDEFAAELANRTVHAVMHLGWVPDGAGAYRGQMAVLVKPNGRLGAVYMAAINPLRRYLVYPALLRQIQRQWAAGTADS